MAEELVEEGPVRGVIAAAKIEGFDGAVCKGLHVGGCVTGMRLSGTHAHWGQEDPDRGFICSSGASAGPLFEKGSSRPKVRLRGEYAHLLVSPDPAVHMAEWRAMCSQLEDRKKGVSAAEKLGEATAARLLALAPPPAEPAAPKRKRKAKELFIGPVLPKQRKVGAMPRVNIPGGRRVGMTPLGFAAHLVMARDGKVAVDALANRTVAGIVTCGLGEVRDGWLFPSEGLGVEACEVAVAWAAAHPEPEAPAEPAVEEASSEAVPAAEPEAGAEVGEASQAA